MTHGKVILLTQLFAVFLCGLFVWGFYETQGIAACTGSSISMCVMEVALLGYFVMAALVALGFAVYLFKAYRVDQ